MSQRVYPVFPGLAFSVTKTPNWATRMQRSISGRTLRTSDYVNPIWTFKLIYAVLHDFPWCSSTSPTELRAMMDFFNSSGGAFDSFLFTDPTDSSVTGQVLPAALSIVTSYGISSAGSGYFVGEEVGPNGGVGPGVAQFNVTSVNGSGGITGLVMTSPGAYTGIPGTTSVPLGTAGSGSGATINLTWATTVQLVRQLAPGGFNENIIAPNNVSNIYFDSGSGPVPQLGWSVDPTTGLVTLANPFSGSSAQPTITADFTYYFRVYFPDALDFEEFAHGFYEIKQVKLTSVVP